MDVQKISLAHPPAGWAVINKPRYLECLLDENVKAVTLLTHGSIDSQAACAALESLEIPVTWSNAERKGAELGDYCWGADAPTHIRKLKPTDLTSDRALLALLAETELIGATLAAHFTGNAAHIVRTQISHWHGFHVTGGLHVDNRPSEPIDVVHQFCRNPMIVSLGGALYQGPGFAHHFCKTSTVPHKADRSQPHRPHMQLGHDVARVVPKFTD